MYVTAVSKRLPLLALGLPIVWLLWAAFVVDVEYYDGYDTICNALYFCGQRQGYIGNRTPLIAMLLAPMRLLSGLFTDDPLHVRTYHLAMALGHTVYLVGVYLCLQRFVTSRAAHLIAFVSAILNVVFFSYAPFLSHDIAPGLLLLLMLCLAEDFARAPDVGPWLLLVALGCAAALTKQTYGLFWFALLVCRCLPFIVVGDRLERTPAIALAWLAVGAVTSAVFYWLIMAFVLAGAYPDTALFLRPLLQIRRLMGQYEGLAGAFPLWIYIRNFPFYGFLTTVFIIPGLWMLLKRNRLCQSAALSWILCFAVLHALGLREVRYVAFLAPLSAVAAAQPVAALLRQGRQRQVLLIGLLLGVDVLSASYEAARLAMPFYGRSELREFTSVIRDGDGWRKPVLTWNLMGFVPPRNSPFAGDRYHRVFHFGVHHLQILYGYGPHEVGTAPSLPWLGTRACQLRNSALFFTNKPLYNGPGFFPGPPVALADYAMLACRAEQIPVRQTTHGWDLENGSKLLAEDVPELGGRGVRIRSARVDKRLFDRYLFPCIRNRTDGRRFALIPAPGGGYTVEGMADLAGLADASAWEFWGYRIRQMSVPAVGRPGAQLLRVD